MTYDEAKEEVYSKLIPKKGDRFWQHSHQILTVSHVTDFTGSQHFVSFTTVHGGGQTKIDEWWDRLNRGVIEPFDLDL